MAYPLDQVIQTTTRLRDEAQTFKTSDEARDYADIHLDKWDYWIVYYNSISCAIVVVQKDGQLRWVGYPERG